ncbi:MAG: tRNA pseudouridine(38-40) synthase TruA [Ilumatobacter sp.]|nr:tRNA pseudouridine(38-40) synthase TruA [Ilumatobacter sp.]
MSEIALRNVRLLVAYDGTDFHGFAASEGVPTVMGALTETLERITQHPVRLTGAGRTDAGVHAWGQVVSGLLPAHTDLERLAMSLNQMLRPAIAVRRAEWADDDFSARFSATSRTYRYDVWNDRVPNPLRARSVWHVGPPLDVDAMNRAAADLVGDHDFSSFCRRPQPAAGVDPPSLQRVVHRAGWQRLGDVPRLQFEITASSFCHQMVRSIVGTLVEVGLGKRDAESIPATLAAAHRNAAGRIAPAAGLVLWYVGYDGPRWDA